MTEPRGQIGFHQIGLGGVLKQYRLRVPSNQREYSWKEREVRTLLTDLARAINNEESEYFLGMIVTIPRAPDLLEVVDGQQRLATTALFLAAVRDYVAGKEELIVEAINNNFLTDIDRDKRERVVKLQLNLDDNEFFRSRISPQPGTLEPTRQSHDLIDGAFEICKQQVKKIVAQHDPKDHGDVLNRWINFIEHRAEVILLRVPSPVNAFKMFETLNDRGLKTSQTDLVKNYLFGIAGERLPEVQQRWALMRGTLDSLDEEDITITFLRHALIAIEGYLRESEVYDAVQRQTKGPESSVKFLNTLESLATTYVAIFNPEHQKWNAYPDTMRRAIQTLLLLNIRPFRPLMLAVAQRFSPPEAAKAFTAFIGWGVRLLIAASTRSGSVEVPLAHAAKEVFNTDIEDTKTLRSRLENVIPPDEAFRQAFEIASVSKASLARYYLRSLEMTAKHEAYPCFLPNDDQQTINLEHVLPTKPEGNWPQFNDEEMRIYPNRLGNLALLRAKGNSDLKSAGFATKRAVFAETPYELTSMIARVSAWTSTQIVARQKKLAELAVKTWPG